MNIFAVANHKGGCGKTALAVNLACQLARHQRVLLVDLDPLAQATLSLGLNPFSFNRTVRHVLEGLAPLTEAIAATYVHQLSLLPANHALEGLPEELAGREDAPYRLADALMTLQDIDTVIIDCPSGFGLGVPWGLAAADRVLVPLQTHFLGLESLALTMRTIYRVTKTHNPRLRLEGLVPSMVDPGSQVARDVIAEAEKNFGPSLLLPAVRYDRKVAEAPARGQPVHWYAARSSVAADYDRIATLIMERHYGTVSRFDLQRRQGAESPAQAA